MDRLEKTHDDEGREIATVLIEQIAAHRPTSVEHALRLAARTGYSVGLELGLHIALQDPTAASRIRHWFRTVVQEDDPLAYEAVARQAATWISGARTDA